jgi:hypothetical protein
MEGDGGGSTLNATVNIIAPASTTKVDNEVENGRGSGPRNGNFLNGPKIVSE